MGTNYRVLMGTDRKLEYRYCGKNCHKYSDCWTFPDDKSRIESWKQQNYITKEIVREVIHHSYFVTYKMKKGKSHISVEN